MAFHRSPSARRRCGIATARWTCRGWSPHLPELSGEEGEGMRRAARYLRRNDLGMTTAEYAVGTVAACGFGTVLYKIVTSDAVMHLLEDLITKALHIF